MRALNRFRYHLLMALVWMAASGCQHSLPFYPIGIYSVNNTNDLATVKSAGFNVVTGPASLSYLNVAQRNDLKVLAYPGTSAGTNFSAAKARTTISQLNSHPALWAWYVVDEPDLNLISPKQTTEANRFIKNLSRTKPTALTLYQGSSAANYANIADILMIDRYPIPWLPLANFPQHVRMARLGTDERKPVIAIIQAFDWSYYPEALSGYENLRPPTYDEIRCMTYCALAYRADGLFYYVFDDGKWRMQEHPDSWAALTRVTAEIHERLPLFQAEHVWKPFKHRFADKATQFNAALESSITPALLRVKNGSKYVPDGNYILTVNNSTQIQSYSFYISELPSGRIAVFEENRSLPIIDHWVQDQFSPYAIHVYGPY